MKNKKIIIAIAAVVVVAAVAIGVAVGVSKSGNDAKVENNTIDVQKVDENGSDSAVKTELPVMMCFISDKDDKADETKKILDELQKEYKDKITFTVINTDETPDAVERYSLNVLNPTGNPTPTYIMLDTKGDFKDFKFGFTDKAGLEESIKKVNE